MLRNLLTGSLVLGIAGWTWAAPVVQLNFDEANPLLNTGAAGGTGTLSGSAVYSNENAPGGSANSGSIHFTNGVLNMGTFADIEGAEQLTITAWIRPDGTAGSGGSGRIVSMTNFVGGFDFYYYDVPDEMEMVIRGTSATGVINGGGHIDGNGVWTFVAVTYDGANMTFYTGDANALSAPDIHEAALGTMKEQSPHQNLVVGNRGDNARKFIGLIDNVHVYNTALSASEIESIRAFNSIVPEPASLALVGLGAALLIRRRR